MGAIVANNAKIPPPPPTPTPPPPPPPPASPDHIKIFSFYGDNTTAQQGIVNVRLTGVPWVVDMPGSKVPCVPGTCFNFSHIDEGFEKYNMSSFIDLEGYNGFVWSAGSNGVPNGLADGWKAVSDTCRPVPTLNIVHINRRLRLELRCYCT